MAEVRFQVLDVGQGSGNFIEIYTDYSDTKLGATILVDLGTERDPGDAAQTASIEYIRLKLCSMDQPTIDLLVLSHSDTDHINLISTLLANFTPYGKPAVLGKPNLLIKIARYAGKYAKFSKRSGPNVLETVKKYMNGGSPEKYPDNYTSFKTDKTFEYYNISGVYVFTLVANVINEGSSAQEESAHWINTRSAVLLISYQETQYVVTGDATGNTIYSMNYVLDYMTKNNQEGFFSRVFMITAPHHGSKTTTFDIKGLGHGNTVNPEENLKKFCNFLKPQCLSASAERVTKFKHPHWSVIHGMSEHLGKEIYFDANYPIEQYGYHSVTVYLNQSTFTDCPWPPAGNFYSFNTEVNLFTNLYCVRTTYYNVAVPPGPAKTYNPITFSPPPYDTIALGASWEFRINETGYGFVSRMDNRWAVNAALKQKLALQRPEMALGDLVEFGAVHAVSAPPAVASPPPVTASPAMARNQFSERSLAASKPVPFSPAAPARTTSRLRQLT